MSQVRDERKLPHLHQGVLVELVNFDPAIFPFPQPSGGNQGVQVRMEVQLASEGMGLVRGGLRDLVAGLKNAAADPNQLSTALSQIESWFQYFDDTAQKMPEKKVDPERQRLEADRAEFEGQKKQEFQRGIANEIGNHTKNEIKRLLGTHLGGKTVADDDFAVFYNTVVGRLQNLMLADKSYVAKQTRFLDAGDRPGAIKFQKEKLAQLLPDAVAKSYRWAYSMGSGAKPAVKPAPAGTPGKATATAPAGWRRVAGPPNPQDVDRSKTSKDMVWKSQAVLKTGQRIFWGDKVPV